MKNPSIPGAASIQSASFSRKPRKFHTNFETQDIDANLKPIKTRALGSKAKRDPVFSALVSVRIEEFGLGMPGWEEAQGIS